jgi:hypothetical protein
LLIFVCKPSLGLCQVSAPPSGSAGVTIQGTVTVCVMQGTSTPRACDKVDSVPIAAQVSDVGRATWDASGNTCTAASETISVPGTLFRLTENATLVGTIETFDATTLTGTANVVGYVGGSCTGSVFNSEDATKRSTSEVSFVISAGGTRIDGNVTKLSLEGIQLGTFSLSGTGFLQ